MLDDEAGKEMALLKTLGLSSGESKVYLSLLSKSEGEMVDKVVTAFGIPANLAEDALKSLSDKGLVKISSNRVEVIQPRTVLQKILEEKNVDMAGYDIPHPLASNAVIYVRTRGSVKPEQVLRNALENARQTNKEFAKEFARALREK